MTTEQLMNKLNYPRETAQAVLGAADIARLAETAYQGDDFPLCRCPSLIRLAVVTYLLTQKFHDYEMRGIPEQVIWDTFRDVPLRAGLYRRKTGEVGISEEDVVWFRHIMKVEIFKIGPMQFQPFEMLYLDKETIGEAYMTFSAAQKRALPPGSPVLNVHVPRGTDLSPAAVEASLAAARLFFDSHFPNTRLRGFLCYSWLLYPPMVCSLGPDSHIRRFAERFAILSTAADPRQAQENLLPGDTALNRLYQTHPDRFGFACGFAEADDKEMYF